MRTRRIVVLALVVTGLAVAVAAWTGSTAQGPVAALLAAGLGGGCVLGWILLAQSVPSDEHGVALRAALLDERTLATKLQAHAEALHADQHGLASTTMAASLTLQVVLDQARAGRPLGAAELELLEESARSLTRAGEIIEAVRQRRMQLWPTELASLEEAATTAVREVSGAFPSVRIAVELAEPAKRRVPVAGGAEALAAVLVELLRNACEGDGRRGATAVRLTADVDGSHPALVLVIEDDGPGVPASTVPLTSTKDARAGLGLFRCDALARTCGGRFSLASHGDRTRAELVLPLATRTDAA